MQRQGLGVGRVGRKQACTSYGKASLSLSLSLSPPHDFHSDANVYNCGIEAFQNTKKAQDFTADETCS